MQFHFQLPKYACGTDGAKRLINETEMEAEIEGSPEDWCVIAIYAEEHVCGGQRFEIQPFSPEFREARNYLRDNPQEREAIEAKLADDLPVRRAAVHEHSTHWGRL